MIKTNWGRIVVRSKTKLFTPVMFELRGEVYEEINTHFVLADPSRLSKRPAPTCNAARIYGLLYSRELSASKRPAGWGPLHAPVPVTHTLNWSGQIFSPPSPTLRKQSCFLHLCEAPVRLGEMVATIYYGEHVSAGVSFTASGALLSSEYRKASKRQTTSH